MKKPFGRHSYFSRTLSFWAVLLATLCTTSCGPAPEDPALESPISSAAAYQEPPITGNNLMAALGDSITAGTLADTWATEPAPFGTFKEWVEQQLGKGLGSPYLNERKNLSWATGEDIRSQYKLLSEYVARVAPAAHVSALNLAVPGSRAWHIGEQALKIAEAMKSGSYQSLLYVTLLVGANDACAGLVEGQDLNEVFRSNLRGVFEILASIRQERKIRVLVSALPKIADLARPEIRDHQLYPLVSCGTIQNQFLNYCKPVLEADPATAERAVEEKNAILRELTEEANLKYPGLEVHFSTSISHWPIAIDDLAMDCFHPNRKAHEILSQRAWEEQPWFK